MIRSSQHDKVCDEMGNCSTKIVSLLDGILDAFFDAPFRRVGFFTFEFVGKF